MIRFKNPSKRRVRWERNDDLSIITGGRSIIRVGGAGDRPSLKSWKRVRNNDNKLKREFTKSRENAHFLMGNHLPATSPSPIVNDPQFSAMNQYFSNFANDSTLSLIPVGSFSFNQQTHKSFSRNGECTLSSLPTLVNTSQSKQAVLSSKLQQPRGILRSVNKNSQNSIHGQHDSSESPSQYWSMYANTGRTQKMRLASTVNSMDTKCKGSKHSSWKICSSMPMTRKTASLVQMEMASTMSGGSSESINGSTCSSSYFPTYSSVNQRMPDTQYGITAMAPPPAPFRQAVPPSLLKGVLPPPSPLIPFSPDSISSSRSNNFSSCGVHQSEWMDRSKCFKNMSTKQYSIEQIVDILCGFATPDSIIADQLFQPFPSASTTTNIIPSSFSPFPINQSNGCQTDIFQTAGINDQSIVNNDENNDHGETSVYFKNIDKKKAVSFLTDSMDNICVTEHLFDPYSQDFCLFSGNSINCTENNNSDILNTTISAHKDVNEMFSTVKSPAPLFELDGSNNVGIVPYSTGKDDFSNPICTENFPLFGETQTEGIEITTSSNSQALNNSFSDILNSFDFSKLSYSDSGDAPKDFENIHSSWNPFLNNLCSEFSNP